MKKLLTKELLFLFTVVLVIIVSLHPGVASTTCDAKPGQLFGGLISAPVYLIPECGADYGVMRKNRGQITNSDQTTMINYELYWLDEQNLNRFMADIKAGLAKTGRSFDTTLGSFSYRTILGRQIAKGIFFKDDQKPNESWQVTIGYADETHSGFTGKPKEEYLVSCTEINVKI
jgi:hypothetical protein